MLSEMHLRRKSSPDEMVDSFYSDVIEIAKKRNYEFNENEKPLLENEFYFDDKDIVLFSIYQHENEIFRKPLQICVGEYFMKDLDEFLRTHFGKVFQEFCLEDSLHFFPQTSHFHKDLR